MRFKLLVIALLLANSIYCQTKWHKEPIYNPLLEKAELKTIEYKSTDYTVVGYVYKDRFLDGQNVTFLTKQTRDTIISGRYYVSNNVAYIDGLWKRSTENGMTRAYGIFQVKNTENEIALTIKPKEGKPLQIETNDIFLYQGFRNKYPATITKQDHSTYLLTIKYTNNPNERDFYKVETKIDKNLISKYGFYAINDFVLYSTDITRYYNDGRVFIGKVENFPAENNYIRPELREGKVTYTQGYYDEQELIKLPDGNFKYKVVYSNRTPNNNIAQMEIVVKKSLIEKYGYWETGKYIYNTPDLMYTYKNGDIYMGKQETTRDSINGGLSIRLTEGKLKYATGEEFEGNIGGEWFCGVPISGTMKFTDGSIKKGNWLKKYSIQTPQEVEEVESAKSPTEKKKIAEKIYQEKVEKQPFVDKYGEYWGTLVYKSEYTLGMTEPMVMDILEKNTTVSLAVILLKSLNGMDGTNLSLKDCYIVSNSGKSIQTMTFSENKFFGFAERAIGKMTNREEQMKVSLSINTLKQPVMLDVFKSNFPTFVFKESKLSEIYYFK